MADKDIVGGMFGITPEMYQQRADELAFAQAQRIGAAASGPGTMLSPSLAPFYTGAAQQGQMLSKGIGGLLGVEDPELSLVRQTSQLAQQIGVNTPEKLQTLAGELQKLPGGAALAAQAIGQANKMLESAATVKQKSRESIPAAEEQANRIRLAQLVEELGPEEGAAAFRKELQEGKVKVAAAGVPQPGMVNVTDLKGAKSIVDDYTKAPRDKLKSVGEIGVLINQISTNPTALPQLQRSLVKLAGDSQIGQNEVKNILGSSGFTADVIDGVNKFLTGAPTNAKIQDVARGVKAIEQFYATQYEQGRETSKRVLANAKLDTRTIDDLIPKAYSTGTQAAIYAVNPQTKERIMSTDGGKTWTPSK
jgi:hypothetical protein